MIRRITSRSLPHLSFSVLLDFVEPLANCEGLSFLASPGTVGTSFIFLEPVLKIVCEEAGSTLSTKDETIFSSPKPWETFVRSLDEIFFAKAPSIPVACGFFSYEFLHHVERVAKAPPLDTAIPRATWFLYRKVLEVSASGEARLHEISYDGEFTPFWQADVDHFPASVTGIEMTPPRPNDDQILAFLDSHSTLTNLEYMNGVDEIRSLIEDGEVYQVNLTRRAFIPCTEEPFQFFRRLLRADPAPYSGFMTFTGTNPRTKLAICSASPELFFESMDGMIRCAPIKGTRPRMECGGVDANERETLRKSEKDLAELAMIVDLMRNDLGRVCSPNSIEVIRHGKVTPHAHVHHLSSLIEGRLQEGTRFSDIIRGLFPAGSITGAPKVAAMTHISKLEMRERGIYTGSLGYLGPQGLSALNVAIRTALLDGSTALIGTGGGIVIDSTPATELLECTHKVRGMAAAFKQE